MKIPYTRAQVTHDDIDAVTKSVTEGWGEKCYDDIELFEANFSKYIGVEFSIATSSATGALHLGLHALGIGEGDEVILADINWVATVSPIVHVGAKPIFVDIDPITWCINPLEVEKSISVRTKAIIATHLYGNLCEINALKTICERHGLYLIEDAAEAIGSYFQNKHAGSFGDFGYFSFHGTKTITSGEGGSFVTNNAKLYKKVKELNNHGRHIGETRQFFANEIGFKFKMSNIQAALVNSQLKRIDQIVLEKQKILSTYRNRLSANQHLMLNPLQENSSSGAWMPTVVFDENLGITREIIIEKFRQNGIDARTFFWPLSKLPPFSLQPDNIHSYSISERAINLPSYLGMSEDEIDYVCEVLLDLL